MGVIQGSINNLLTTAGVAARLSPRAEEKIAEKRGVAEAQAKIAEVRAEAEPAAQKATEIINKQSLYFTKGGTADLRRSAEQFEGAEVELDKAISYLQKAEALSPNSERQQLLENAYASKSELRKGALSKRQKQQEAEKNASEALLLKQEEVKKSEQFRTMFTNWRNL